MNSLNFRNNTARDKFEEFLQDYTEYINDDLSIKKAKRAIMNAWHLVDWTFEDYRSIHNLNNIGAFRESIYPRCESLKIMHDLANSDKHKILTRPKADLKNTKEHQGGFSNAFNKGFNVSYLQIEKNDGTILSLTDQIENVKNFWEEYFSDK